MLQKLNDDDKETEEKNNNKTMIEQMFIYTHQFFNTHHLRLKILKQKKCPTIWFMMFYRSVHTVHTQYYR